MREFLLFFSSVFVLCVAIVNIAFAIGVLIDSRAFAHPQDSRFPLNRRKLVLVGHTGWVLATLLGGVLVALAYWIVHHSTLRPDAVPALSGQGRLPELPEV